MTVEHASGHGSARLIAKCKRGHLRTYWMKELMALTA
jgi:hypothetical protein